MTTLAELRTRLVEALEAFLPAHEARAEAWRWFEEGLEVPRSRVAAFGETPVPEADLAKVEAWLERRRAGEPWSYLAGWAPFRGRRFQVDARVLIPRPETELVLEAALDVGRRLGVSRAVDVGTGSGILGICLALETDWAVTATDLSVEALAVARANAAALGAPLAFGEGHLLEAVGDPLELVVSNPPYVPLADGPGLQRELAFEPAGALFAEEEGLALSKELLRTALARQAAACVLEIGAGQGEALSAFARTRGWRRVAVHQDFAGHDRILLALR